MSYSHAADGKLAPALQRGIERLGKPWYRRPLIRVFRDETSLSANPGLWSGIQAALEQCEYLLLMCSQKSNASPWVQKEVAWWLANRPASRLLLVVTDGEVAWDSLAQDFDWSKTDCVPAILSHRFTEEPYYIDLRWAKYRNDLSLRNPKFRSAVLTLAATLHGRPMEELDSENLRQQRNLRIVATATTAVILLLVGVAYFSQRSSRNAAHEAESANRIADSRRIAAAASTLASNHGDPHQAILLAVLAWRIAHTDEALSILGQLGRSSTDIARIIGQHSSSGVWVRAFTHAPDGSPVLLTADNDGGIMAWHIPSGLVAHTAFRIGQENPNGLRFSEDGSRMLSLDGSSDAKRPAGLVLTDLKSMTARQFPAQALPAAFGANYLKSGQAAISPSGRFVAICAINNEIALWDTQTGAVSVKHIQLRPSTYLFAISFLDDSHLLLVATVPEHSGYLPNNRRVGPYLGIWNRSADQVQLGAPTIVDHDVSIDSEAVFNADSSKILIFNILFSEPMLLYDRDAGMNLRQIRLPGNADTDHSDSSEPMMNRSGSRVAGSWGNKTIAWDLEHSTILKNTESYNASALSQDGRWLAANVGDRITIWDLNAAKDTGLTLKTSCTPNTEDKEGCIQLLCEKLTPEIRDTDELQRTLGWSDLERLKRTALNTPCQRP